MCPITRTTHQNETTHLGDALHRLLASHNFDMENSARTLLIFIVPVVIHRLKYGKSLTS